MSFIPESLRSPLGDASCVEPKVARASWPALHCLPGFQKFRALRTGPVNILNGEVCVVQNDFHLPGVLPLTWWRSYGSAGTHSGLCGVGWQTLADVRLEVSLAHGRVTLQGLPGGALKFARLPRSSADIEHTEGARLSHHAEEWRVTTREDRIYRFPHAMVRQLSDGRLLVGMGSMDDRCGNRWCFEWRDGLPVALQGPAGRRLVLTHQATPHGPRLAAATLMDAATREHGFVRYEYDSAGDLTAVIDTLGVPCRFAYEQHRMVRYTDRNGLSFYYAFEAYDTAAEPAWRVVRAWGEGGLYDHRIRYCDVRNERQLTDTHGQVRHVTLNEQGLPICEVDPHQGRTRYEYDPMGRTTAVVDPEGRRTQYAHDGRGNLLKLTQPDGTVLSARYNDDDKPVALVDANGSTWQQHWDERGLLVEQITPLLQVSRFEYDRRGQLVTCTHPRGAYTRLAYDKRGHLSGMTDALGYTCHFEHDALGHLVMHSDPQGRQTRYQRNPLGRLTGVSLPGGGSLRCSYDAEGHLIEHVDANGATTRLAHGGRGELVRQVLPDGGELQYRYDAELRLTGLINPRGEMHELQRDALGRIVQSIDYWGQSWHYRYSAAGHLQQCTDPLGRVTEIITDVMGRMLSRRSVGSAGGEERFSYDANGRLIAAVNAHVSLMREWDAQGRLLSEMQQHLEGPHFLVVNRYDDAGNRIERRTSSSEGRGHTVQWTHDLLNQITSQQMDDHAPQPMRRDELGRVIEAELAPGLARHCRYDAEGRLTAQALTRPGERLFLTRYHYDAAGNLLQRLDSRYGTDQYVYDPMGQVLQHTEPTGFVRHYLRSPAGAGLQTRVHEREEGPWWRTGEHDGVVYRFDRAGHLVGKTSGTMRLTLDWDAQQHLVSTRRTLSQGNAEHDRLTHYGYDPLGRRLFKETDGLRTWFGWDGESVAFEHGPGGQREYVHEPHSLVPMAMLVELTGPERHLLPTQVLHFLNDPNGCPARLIDAAGLVWWGAGYSAWGKVDVQHTHALDNPIRLQGQYADTETGLYYHRHRYFDCDIGLFTAPDSQGLPASGDSYRLGPNAWACAVPSVVHCALPCVAPHLPLVALPALRCSDLAVLPRSGHAR